MPYTDTYPRLSARFPAAPASPAYHLDAVMDALKEFSDLFAPETLERALADSAKAIPYLELFNMCVRGVEGKYTSEEVVAIIAQNLQAPDVRIFVTKFYVFVPKDVKDDRTYQLAFMEKLATDGLVPHQSLSYIDMLRVLDRISGHGRVVYAVSNYKHIQHVGRDVQVIFVNFNDDPHKEPQWAALDRRPSQWRIFCDTPISELHKKALHKALGRVISPGNYLGGRYALSPATGYSAIAWCQENVLRDRNALVLDSDFYALVEEWLFLHDSLKSWGECKSVDDSYKTKEYKSKVGELKHYEFARAAILGEMESAPRFRAGDLCGALKTPFCEGIQVNVNKRTYVLALDETLRRLEILREEGGEVNLLIPEAFNTHLLEDTYKICSGPYAVSWLDNVNKVGSKKHAGNFNLRDLATACVMMVFRARAKKPKLSITLPTQFQLDTEEQNVIRMFMAENPYVTELIVNNNYSLLILQEEFRAIFGRNRWLAHNEYCPPMVGNHWQPAARYWVSYLHKNRDLLEDKREYAAFKSCVKDMGLAGLKPLLSYLSDPYNREHIESMYGRDKRAFYAAWSSPREMVPYLQAILTHVRQVDAVFPFNQLAIQYQQDSDDLLVDLMDEFNGIGNFEQIVLTNFLHAPSDTRQTFLRRLSTLANTKEWVGLVVIPELEDKTTTQASLIADRATYRMLNNIILRNRRTQSARAILHDIQERPSAPALQPVQALAPAAAAAAGAPTVEALRAELATKVERLGPLADARWPLLAMTSQLEMQIQQQVQQQVQQQQEQQRIRVRNVESAYAGDLVTYDNIDRLLGGFCATLQAEHPLCEEFAVLGTDGASLLQKFFHTWVNAAPKVEAAHVIRSMTPEAARELLRKHTLLSSGLNPDNLPKGFYTQRLADGQLALFYDYAQGSVCPPSPLTLDLSVTAPKVVAWEGDFRQFDLERYLGAAPIWPLEEADWNNLALFAQLQPIPEAGYKTDVDTFLVQNPGLRTILTGRTYSAAIQYWPMVLQLWQYRGMDGVRAFADVKPALRQLSPEELLSALLRAEPTLVTWAQTIQLNEDSILALGQVYYRDGLQGVRMLLAHLQHIETMLGSDTFVIFTQSVLNRTANFTAFMTLPWFSAMDKMVEQLRYDAAKKAAWNAVLQIHMRSVGWDQVDALWRGFSYFVAEIDKLGLSLSGEEFNALIAGGIRPTENMLVFMDRVVRGLQRLGELEAKQQYLRTCAIGDRTHGGVYYALEYEGFRHLRPELALHDFYHGNPTYTPNLKTLYSWPPEQAPFYTVRYLSYCNKFVRIRDFDYAVSKLTPLALPDQQAALMVCSHVEKPISMDNIPFVDACIGMDTRFLQVIGRHLHRAIYEMGGKQVVIRIDALQRLASIDGPGLPALLDRFALGTVLEAVNILFQRQTSWDSAAAVQFLQLMGSDFPESCIREPYKLSAFKLAALFGIKKHTDLLALFKEMDRAIPVVQKELSLLYPHLLSIEYSGDPAALNAPENWADLITAVQEMKANPANTAAYRLKLVTALESRGLVFKFSKRGDLRGLGEVASDKDQINLHTFVDHGDRLWEFMTKHLLVARSATPEDIKEELRPIYAFLRALQLNKTYLNELEPLLAAFAQKTKAGTYWTISYFADLLRAFEPEGNCAFPMSLFREMLDEVYIAAKPQDEVGLEFPGLLKTNIQIVLKTAAFNRQQQTLLCKILVHELSWSAGESISVQPDIMALFLQDVHAPSRDAALAILSKCSDQTELKQGFENCRWLLQLSSSHTEVQAQWTATAALWLRSVSTSEQDQALLGKIRTVCVGDLTEKVPLVLHIAGWSLLHVGLESKDDHKSAQRKGPKLVVRLAEMSLEDLDILAQYCHARPPTPTASDLLRLIKGAKTDGLTWPVRLDRLMGRPFPEPRSDFGLPAATRRADIKRTIEQLQMSGRELAQPISLKDSARLAFAISHLNALESGEIIIIGHKRILEMSESELKMLFATHVQALKHSPQNDILRIEVWAIMFEALARTTRKYPHNAQKIALLAGDLCLTQGQSRLLQLATGEGKSHFVAMRAAMLAAMGMKVDVSTAKRSLAERDRDDYEPFFTCLGIKTAYVHPKSARSAYTDANVCYSTLGDLSLLRDECSYRGDPLPFEKEKSVILMDEFDFTYSEEGVNTQYNYAIPTGKMPKQMMWFYETVYKTYEAKIRGGITSVMPPATPYISMVMVRALIDALIFDAGQSEEKLEFVRTLIEEATRTEFLPFRQWIQAAHQACGLQQGVGFTVREETLTIGDDTYPIMEIIPLSLDNQALKGSSYAGGMHQLLAVRLNLQAKVERRPTNYHVLPESHILSSQIAAERLSQYGHFEGFTGTVSAAEATALSYEYGAMVLHVPTNQRSLRHWPAPTFYRGYDACLASLEEQTRALADEIKPVRLAEITRIRAIVEPGMRAKEIAEFTRLIAMVDKVRECIRKKQSVLMACKDDKQVLAFQAKIAALLSLEERESMMYFTNEDPRSSSQVLEEKHAQEQWKAGKKSKAVVLVASCFGRGDNVDVEVVMLPSVSTKNDQLQKGGRTARNGAEGTVHQFYVIEELEEEERACLDVAGRLGVDLAPLRKLLPTEGCSQEKRDSLCFERVMILREWRNRQHNEESLIYHGLLAEFSTWTMSLLGCMDEGDKRGDMIKDVSSAMKSIERIWSGISSTIDSNFSDNIMRLRPEILAQATVLLDKYRDLTAKDYGTFQFAHRPRAPLQLVVPDLALSPAAVRSAKARASISLALMSLEGRKDAEVASVLTKLEQLEHSGPEHVLDFATQLDSCAHWDQFVTQLDLQLELRRAQEAELRVVEVRREAIEAKRVSDERREYAAVADKRFADARQEHEETVRAQQASGALEAQVILAKTKADIAFDAAAVARLRAEQAAGYAEHRVQEALRLIPQSRPGLKALYGIKSAPIAAEELLTASNAQACLTALRALIPGLQDQAVLALCQPGIVALEVRVSNAASLFRYLGCFTVEQQAEWGPEYLDVFLSGSNARPFMEAGKPLSLPHYQGLERLTCEVVQDPSARAQYLQDIANIVAVSPENRIRMITQWSAWATQVGKKAEFLHAFTHTMSMFKEGDNWDTFTALVQQTQKQWNKDRKGDYIPGLLQLWSNLAKEAEYLPQINDLLHWAMHHLNGKSWFMVLNICFEHLNGEQLLAHWLQIESIWGDIYTDASLPKKSDKHRQFVAYVQGLKLFHSIPFSSEQAAAAKYHFQALRGKHLVRAIDELRTKEALFKQHPELFITQLDPLSLTCGFEDHDGNVYDDLHVLSAIILRMPATTQQALRTSILALSAQKRSCLRTLIQQPSMLGGLRGSFESKDMQAADLCSAFQAFFATQSSLDKAQASAAKLRVEKWNAGRMWQCPLILEVTVGYLADSQMSIPKAQLAAEVLIQLAETNPLLIQGDDARDFLSSFNTFLMQPHEHALDILSRLLKTCDPKFSKPLVSDGFVHAFCNKVCGSGFLPANIDTYLVAVHHFYSATEFLTPTELARLQESMMAIPTTQLGWLLTWIAENRTLVTGRPKVLQAMMQYAAVPHISAARLQRLGNVVAKAVVFHEPEVVQEQAVIAMEEYTAIAGMVGAVVEESETGVTLTYEGLSFGESNVSFNHLIAGVDLYKNAPKEELDILLESLELHKDYTDEILFDHTSQYLSFLSQEDRTVIRPLILQFYDAARDKDAQKFRAIEEQLFIWGQDADFRRIQWMRMLCRGVFCSNEAVKPPSDDTARFKWTQQDNDALLQRGFDLYVEHTKAVLASTTKSKSSVVDKRGTALSLRKRQQLVAVAREMQDILESPVHMTEPLKRAQEEGLYKTLNLTLGTYGRSFFVSDKRKERYTQLMQDLSKVTPRAVSSCHYEDVLSLLRNAKTQAIEDDIAANKGRIWFPLNRSGSSRYLDTIQRMQDLVISHWCQDRQAIKRFQLVTHELTFDFDKIKTYFFTALRQHLTPGHKGREAQLLFQPGNTRLLAELLKCCPSNCRMEELVPLLQKTYSQLPQYLKPIAKELLTAGESLVAGVPLAAPAA